jgi:ribose-phosphate pyrophosphokinase
VNAVCIYFPADATFGTRLAGELGIEHSALEVHRFPDGESRVRLATSCAGMNVILVNGGRDPDATALPLCFAAHAARATGSSSIGLVAPYLPYMRQDCQFREGEAVSALAYSRFLSGCVDWLATVDPHLHRIRSLDAIFTIPALCVASMPAVAEWIGKNVLDPVIVGPDEESRQWVERVAQALAVPWTTLSKQRLGDRSVSVSLPDPAILCGRAPVLVDDIASSGRTLAEAARVLRRLGAPPVTCVVVHALLGPEAEPELRAAGVARLVSTNTLAHSTNGIDVIPIVARAVHGMLARG